MPEPELSESEQRLHEAIVNAGTSLLLLGFRESVALLQASDLSEVQIMQSIEAAVAVLQTGMSVAELETGTPWGA